MLHTAEDLSEVQIARIRGGSRFDLSASVVDFVLLAAAKRGLISFVKGGARFGLPAPVAGFVLLATAHNMYDSCNNSRTIPDKTL